MNAKERSKDGRRRRAVAVAGVVLAGVLPLHGTAVAEPSGTAEERRPVEGSFDVPPFTEPNPCTGEEQTVYITIAGAIQVFETDERFHLHGRGELTIRTSLGFEGTAQHNFHENAAKEGDQATINETFNAVLADDSGLRYRVRNRGHLTIAEGEIRSITVEGEPDFDCLG